MYKDFFIEAALPALASHHPCMIEMLSVCHIVGTLRGEFQPKSIKLQACTFPIVTAAPQTQLNNNNGNDINVSWVEIYHTTIYII